MGIPEKKLEQFTAEVMGTGKFDGELFREQVREILVPEDDVLEYRFFDGRVVSYKWERPRRGKRKVAA